MDRLGIESHLVPQTAQTKQYKPFGDSIMPGFFSHFHNPFGSPPAPAPAPEQAKPARKRTPRARKPKADDRCND